MVVDRSPSALGRDAIILAVTGFALYFLQPFLKTHGVPVGDTLLIDSLIWIVAGVITIAFIFAALFVFHALFIAPAQVYAEQWQQIQAFQKAPTPRSELRNSVLLIAGEVRAYSELVLQRDYSARYHVLRRSVRSSNHPVWIDGEANRLRSELLRRCDEFKAADEARAAQLQTEIAIYTSALLEKLG